MLFSLSFFHYFRKSFDYVIIGACFLITRLRIRPRELSRLGSFFLWLTLWSCRMVGNHIQTKSLLGWRWLHYYRDILLGCFFLNMLWQCLFFFFSKACRAEGADEKIIWWSTQTNYRDGIFNAPCFDIKIWHAYVFISQIW